MGKNITDIPPAKYDLLMYYNLDMMALSFFAYLYEINQDIECARYEEGILSYNNPVYVCAKFKCGNILRNLLRKKTIIQKTKSFYCCYPSFYSGNLSVVEIPKINVSSEIGNVLKFIFNLKEEDLYYKEKYIYFSSVYDFEGGYPIGEINFVETLRNYVGNDNLLVKVHPRDKRTIYGDKGFHVDRNSKIPWEAIQLNMDCSDKVFITINSSSVLSINMLIEPMPKTIFAYHCCNYKRNKTAVITIRNLETLLHSNEYKKYFKTVKIIQNINEL